MQDHGRLYGAVFALRILARKYEFKDEEDRGPLTGIVNSAFPVLLQLFQVGLISDLLTAHAPGIQPDIQCMTCPENACVTESLAVQYFFQACRCQSSPTSGNAMCLRMCDTILLYAKHNTDRHKHET